MSLLNLINNLSRNEKTRLLGATTTRILRYTFSSKDTEAIDDKIIDKALAVKHGEDFITKEAFIVTLIESIPLPLLKSKGFSDFDIAIDIYTKDRAKFIEDFNIEAKYLPKEIIDERSNFTSAKPVYGECNGINAYPHFYQLKLKDQILNDIYQNYHGSILVTMPTGAGKTVLAMEVLVDYFRSSRTRKKYIHAAWFVSSKELCEQSLISFNKIWKQKGDREVVAFRYFDRFNELDFRSVDKITFGGFPLISSRLESSQLKEYLSTIDILFIDEAHGAKAETRDETISIYKNSKKNYQIVGLTATPFRNDDEEYSNLKDSFNSYFEITDSDDVPISSPIEFLIKNQFLASLQFEKLESIEGGDNSEYYSTLHSSVLTECRNLIGNGQNVIIFASSKSHAIALNIYLSDFEIENEVIIGDTSIGKRKKYLQDFGNSESTLNVLINHQILSTGIDVPGMNAIMILGDISSPTLAMQILGRAMRGPKNGGNSINKVFLTNKNYVKLSDFKIIEQTVLQR